MHIFDYILVHDICHLLRYAHSAKFWTEVGQVMPNHKNNKRLIEGMLVV
ncbi:MAG: putative metal-dependent hydrolase [Psychromonas sp.]|jgi:predicted metal-dependent hydrolase